MRKLQDEIERIFAKLNMKTEITAFNSPMDIPEALFADCNMAFLDIDSVVYYQNLLKEKTEVFGRNLFNNELLTFEPAMNIPAPADYVLGAGDQVVIDVWVRNDLFTF